jgi:hypothetical protein
MLNFFPVLKKKLTADYCENNLLYLLVYVGTTFNAKYRSNFYLENKSNSQIISNPAEFDNTGIYSGHYLYSVMIFGSVYSNKESYEDAQVCVSILENTLPTPGS